MRRSLSLCAAAALAALAAPRTLWGQSRYPLELQVMPVQQSVHRNLVDFDGSVRQQTGTLKGLEVNLLGKSSGIGLFGRMHSGTVGVTSGRQLLEGGLMIGEKSFRLQFAYSERKGAIIDTTYRLLSGGFQAVSDLGSSGIALKMRAAFGLPIDRIKGEAGQVKMGDMWEGETAVTYTWSRLPIFAQIGYRMERMRLMPRDQELSGLVLGAGIWMRP
jgi:hypothetical protein